jgi:FkbM family methyltransferase
VRLGDLTWHVGLRTSEIYVLEEVFSYGMYDKIADYVVQPGWFVLDGGANIGVFTVVAAKRGARVVAIEPNHACFERLLQNVTVNGVASLVRPVNAALGAQAGLGTMVVERGGTTGGFVTESSSACSSGAWVQVCTLDELLKDDDGLVIDLLKLDVEGAELVALLGGDNVLGRTDRVILEYHSTDLLEHVRTTLHGYGFVEDLSFVYQPGEPEHDVAEVGILYAAKPH